MYLGAGTVISEVSEVQISAEMDIESKFQPNKEQSSQKSVQFSKLLQVSSTSRRMFATSRLPEKKCVQEI